MPRGRGNPKHIIANVPKVLVREQYSDMVFRFRYPESSDGFAKVILSKNEVTRAKSNKACQIEMCPYNTYVLTYKDGTEFTTKRMSPAGIKMAFERTRSRRKVNDTREQCTTDALCNDYEADEDTMCL